MHQVKYLQQGPFVIRMPSSSGALSRFNITVVWCWSDLIFCHHCTASWGAAFLDNLKDSKVLLCSGGNNVQSMHTPCTTLKPLAVKCFNQLYYLFIVILLTTLRHCSVRLRWSKVDFLPVSSSVDNPPHMWEEQLQMYVHGSLLRNTIQIPFQDNHSSHGESVLPELCKKSKSRTTNDSADHMELGSGPPWIRHTWEASELWINTGSTSCCLWVEHEWVHWVRIQVL